MDAIIDGIRNRIISGTVSVPGDKSITHRGIILGSIANGTTSIKNYLDSSDCNNTMACMKSLGVSIDVTENGLLEIKGKGLKGLQAPDNVLQVGNSGTTMRLLAGLLSGQLFNSILDGDFSIRKRPMERIIEPLSLMGAEIKGWQQTDFAPLEIIGSMLQGIEYTLPVASAQVKSALLLAGLYARGETTIHEPQGTRDHTERMMELMQADLKIDCNGITITQRTDLKSSFIDIPGDISSAAYFLALASARKGANIIIKNVGINPTRTGFLNVLEKMGADIVLMNEQVLSNEPRADIRIIGSQLKGIIIDGEIIPSIIDELPLLAVIATQAKGVTMVSDAKELRVKETDRIKAMVKELSSMGASISEREDGFQVKGPCKLNGTVVDSYYDHRIAMSLIIAASYARGKTIIKERDCLNISYPDFLNSYYSLVN